MARRASRISPGAGHYIPPRRANSQARPLPINPNVSSNTMNRQRCLPKHDGLGLFTNPAFFEVLAFLACEHFFFGCRDFRRDAFFSHSVDG